MGSYEYWLISAPGDKTCQQTFDKLNQATTKQQLSTNWKFHVPDLKVGEDYTVVLLLYSHALLSIIPHLCTMYLCQVGTLDQLVGLSDDLGKLDGFVEQITRKVSNYLGEVLEEQRDKLGENLLANGVDLATYVTQFRWDMAKYPIKQSLKNLSDIISKQVSQIESDLKSKV